MPEKITIHSEVFSKNMLALRDTLNIMNGKWKMAIMFSLTEEKKRFKELQRHVGKITGKMLSQKLKGLEMNERIKRTVLDTKPVTVEYELTAYGRSLEKIRVG